MCGNSRANIKKYFYNISIGFSEKLDFLLFYSF